MDLLRIVNAAYNATTKFVKFGARTWTRADGSEGAADEAAYLHPMGLAVLPVVTRTLRAFAQQVGHDWLALFLFDKAKAIADLASGETRLYSVGRITVAISLRNDGSIHLTSDGGNIVLNGGSANVARANDPVTASAALTTWMNAVTIATGVPALVGSTIGAVGGGNATVKA